jgi:hypothetical protein
MTSSTSQQPAFTRKIGRYAWLIYAVTAYIGIILVPLILVEYDYPFVQVLLAMVLLGVCLYPTARHFALNESGIPFFATLCISFAVQFAVPVFTNNASIHLANAVIAYQEDSDVIEALVLSIIGVCVLQVGYYRFQTTRAFKAIPVVDLHLNRKRAVVYCVLVIALLFLISGPSFFIGDEAHLQFAAIIFLLQNQALVAIGILGWIIYSGNAKIWHRILLYLIVGYLTLRGISNGMLEQVVLPITVLFVTKWLYTKRLPVNRLIVIALIIFFLSPVKGTFRQTVWYGSETSASMSLIDRVAFWVSEAGQYWIETLSGTRTISDSTSDALTRTDMIHQLAYVYSLTPSEIPFQYGGTYSYFFVAFIPRIIWPNKPVATANSTFAVTYRITTEEGARRSTFGMGLVTEAYINFGWYGVLIIMFLQGAILGLLQHIFGGIKSGPGGQAVFLAFFIFFLNGIGSSAEILYGNIVQNLIASCILLWWAREKYFMRKIQATSAKHLVLPK